MSAVLFATLLGVIHAQVINIDANGDPSAAANAIKVMCCGGQCLRTPNYTTHDQQLRHYK